MVITMAGQLKQLFVMMICGFLFALAYDLIRLFRRVIPHTELHTAAEDILFWLFGAVIFELLIFWLNSGQIRAFMFLGVFIGAMIYLTVISAFFLKLSTLVIEYTFKIIYLLLYPLRVTCETIMAIFEYFVNFFKKALIKYSKYAKIYSAMGRGYIAGILRSIRGNVTVAGKKNGNRKNKKNKFNIFIIMCLLVLMVMFFFAMYTQASEYFEMKEELQQTYKEQAKAVKKNQDAVSEMIYHDSDEYIEKIARERLNLVKPNEIVFIDENK